MKKVVIILNNIRSSENVGSIFRTADAVRVSKIILCGYTPAPIDRFGRENKGLIKASLGAEKFIKWEKRETLKETIEIIQEKRGGNRFVVIGIEQDERAIDYKSIDKSKNIVLVFGNEVDGLSKEELKLCDIVASLPMYGKKESLNVSVCAGIVLYSLL